MKKTKKRQIPNSRFKIQEFGFTLIEMLVVISIIGILATLVAANLTSARSRARDAQRKSDVKNISTALRLYYNDTGGFPDPATLPWGLAWSGNSGNTVYMSTLPQDPLSPTQTYKYESSTPFDTFILSACLENASDIQGVDATGSYATWCPGSKRMFQIKQ